MEWLHAHAGAIARVCAIVGAAAMFVGVRDLLRAPVLAAKRGAAVADERGSPVTAADADRYRRGLTDFYRIQGALKALAGLVVLIVSGVAR